MTSFRVIQAEVSEGLRQLPDACVQTCITSPPYWGLRDYGTGEWVGGEPDCEHEGQVVLSANSQDGLNAAADKYQPGKSRRAKSSKIADPVKGGDCRCGATRKDDQLGLEATPDEFVANMVNIFREVRRVLRDDGTVWLNLGDSYVGNKTTGRNDAETHWQGNDVKTAVASWGKPKDLVGIPWRVAFALQADGWYLRSDIIWHKPNPMPESVTDRPTKAHEYLFLLTKSPKYFYDAYAVRETSRTGSWSAMPPTDGVKQAEGNDNATYSGNTPAGDGTRNRRSVWSITTKGFSGAHFAVFPPELVEPCVLAGTSAGGACPECGAPYKRVLEAGAPLIDQQRASDGDANSEYHGEAVKDYEGTGAENASEVKARILEGMRERKTVGWWPTCDHDSGEPVPQLVLDTFTGSGTTGMVALRHSRDFVGTELNPEYAQMARKRIYDDAPLLNVDESD